MTTFQTATKPPSDLVSIMQQSNLMRWVLLLPCVALGLAFMVPATRGLPVGDSQLRDMLPAELTTMLDASATLALLATIAAALFMLIVDPLRPFRSHPVLLGVSLIVAGVAIGLFRGFVGPSEVRHAVAHGQFATAYIIAIGLPIIHRSDWSRVLAVLRIALTIPGVMSLIIIVLNSTGEIVWYTRVLPAGTSFGGAACLLWLAHAQATKQKRFYALSALSAAGVAISGLRGWVGALVVGLVVYAVMRVRSQGRKVRIRPAGLAAAAAALFVTFALAWQLGWADLYVRRTARGVTGGSSLRGRQMRNLLREWAEGPFFGSGLGYRNPDLARVGVPLEVPRPYLVELSYLNLLAKMGLVGFGLLVAGLVIVLRELYRCTRRCGGDRESTALFASTLYLLLTSVFNPTFESVYLHLFIALALYRTLIVGGRAWSTADPWSMSARPVAAASLLSRGENARL